MSIEQPTTDLIVNPRYLIFVDKNFLALSKQTATENKNKPSYFLLNIFPSFSFHYIMISIVFLRNLEFEGIL